MSLISWKKLAKWAENNDKKAEERKLKRRALMPWRPLTYAQFCNKMLEFDGTLTSLIEMAGNITLQRLSEMTARYVDEMGTALSDVFDTKLMVLREWIEGSFRLYENSMKHFFETFNAASEIRHKEVMDGMIAMISVVEAQSNNQAARYLAIQEAIRQTREESFNANEVNFNTMIGLFENLTEQIQAMRKGETIESEKAGEPSLNWFMENAEELVRFGSAMKALQENTAPSDMARLEIVKCVRALTNHEVSMTDIRDAVDAKAEAFSLAA